MPTDFEERVARSLRDQAGQGRPIDPAPLMYGAKAQGKRIQVRRRVGAGVLAAAVVLGGVFTAVRVNGSHPDPVRSPRPTPSVSGLALPPVQNLDLLPKADIPGASIRPDLVATDPSVLHVNIDALLTKARSAYWHATLDDEEASVLTEAYGSVEVDIARKQASLPKYGGGAGAAFSEPAPITIGGIAGTYRVVTRSAALNGQATYVLNWQPASGVWAELGLGSGYFGMPRATLASALAAAAAVRFDQGTPCATPIQFGAPPAGTTLRSCELQLDPEYVKTGPFYHAEVVFGGPQQHIEIEMTNVGVRPLPVKEPLKAGAFHVRKEGGNSVYTDAYSTEVAGMAVVLGVIDKKKQPWTQAQLLDMFGSIQVVGVAAQPRTFQPFLVK